ncbi:hypothetical protein XELAEV_18044137mg [Xenopus laevis]|uniref:Uncharacterized protein n=1 Tax=Xenopus laevis TaxID=8355 RepID=A0A974BYI0_XENLA|nr:hypothetical protein XELAEV_18044137mg [Xenopus laevis]
MGGVLEFALVARYCSTDSSIWRSLASETGAGAADAGGAATPGGTGGAAWGLEGLAGAPFPSACTFPSTHPDLSALNSSCASSSDFTTTLASSGTAAILQREFMPLRRLSLRHYKDQPIIMSSVHP